MKNQHLEILGAWIVALGTIGNAIGSTPNIFLGVGREDIVFDELNSKLKFSGNAYQAVGNVLEAVGEDTLSLEKIGEEIQAAGNVTVLYAIDVETDETKKIEVEITGNLLQAFGAYLAAVDEFSNDSFDQKLDAFGNFLQTIGNTTQAVGGFALLQGLEQTFIKLEEIGSWVQAFGAIISAIATQLEVTPDDPISS